MWQLLLLTCRETTLSSIPWKTCGWAYKLPHVISLSATSQLFQAEIWCCIRFQTCFHGKEGHLKVTLLAAYVSPLLCPCCLKVICTGWLCSYLNLELRHIWGWGGHKGAVFTWHIYDAPLSKSWRIIQIIVQYKNSQTESNRTGAKKDKRPFLRIIPKLHVEDAIVKEYWYHK